MAFQSAEGPALPLGPRCADQARASAHRPELLHISSGSICSCRNQPCHAQRRAEHTGGRHRDGPVGTASARIVVDDVQPRNPQVGAASQTVHVLRPPFVGRRLPCSRHPARHEGVIPQSIGVTDDRTTTEDLVQESVDLLKIRSPRRCGHKVPGDAYSREQCAQGKQGDLVLLPLLAGKAGGRMRGQKPVLDSQSPISGQADGHTGVYFDRIQNPSHSRAGRFGRFIYTLRSHSVMMAVRVDGEPGRSVTMHGHVAAMAPNEGNDTTDWAHESQRRTESSEAQGRLAHC
ncbi:hypothetical protein GA0115239_101136 [Streptomyces sp. BpilaLS-43]|nr:hypothetical protein GA0115239_101136 [Streptomyces sp. BpilaLS-43]